MQHLSVINENKHKIEKRFSYPILCPLRHLHQIKQIKTKFTQLRIYLNVACQVHIVETNASTKRGHLIDQVQNIDVK